MNYRRLPRHATREQINAWLTEREHIERMRALVRFRCNCPDYEQGCDCEHCDRHDRRIHIHRRINFRGETA